MGHVPDKVRRHSGPAYWKCPALGMTSIWHLTLPETGPTPGV